MYTLQPKILGGWVLSQNTNSQNYTSKIYKVNMYTLQLFFAPRAPFKYYSVIVIHSVVSF